MRFFLDNNMAPGHARALNALSEDHGTTVVHLKDRYEDRAVGDDVWLSELGKEGTWNVLSADQRIWTTPHLRAAWRQSGLTVFFLVDSWGNLAYWDKTVALVRAWPNILKIASAVAPGAAYEVPRPPRPLKQLRA